MKKVLVVPSNTDLNRGDQSLTWETIEIAKEVFENVEVCIFKSVNDFGSDENLNSQTELKGHKILTRILMHPRRGSSSSNVKYNKLEKIKWGFRALKDTLVTLLLLSKVSIFNKLALGSLSNDQKETYKYFEDLDAVFVKGGGFLHSYGSIMDIYVMYFQLFDVFLAKKMKKKVFIFPNSMGPFRNKIARKIVKKALQSCSIVCAREGVSYDVLDELGVKDRMLSPDLGFYLKSSDRDFKNYLSQSGVNLEAPKKIAITLRPYRFDGKANSDELYKQYIDQFRKVINKCIKRDFHVSLVAHTIGPSAHENDCIPLLELYKDFETHKSVSYLFDPKLDCKDIEKMYSYYDLVIGTRFHSVIFALNVGTPSIAIAYGGNKAVGIMNDMNLSQFVLPIENPDARIIMERTDEVFSDNQAYVEKINVYKDLLKTEREKLINAIKNKLN